MTLQMLDNLVMSGGGLQPLPQVLHGEAHQGQSGGDVSDYQKSHQERMTLKCCRICLTQSNLTSDKIILNGYELQQIYLTRP